MEFKLAAAELISSALDVLAPLLPPDAVMDFVFQTNRVQVCVRSGRRLPEAPGSILMTRTIDGKTQLLEVKPQVRTLPSPFHVPHSGRLFTRGRAN